MEDTFEFVEKMTKYFGNFDENYMDGYIKIIRQFYDALINKKIISSDEDINNYFDKIDETLEKDNGISPSISVKRALAFFCSLGPRYEQMSLNLINEIEFSSGNNMGSSAYSVRLSGNEYDASLIIHETTHSFVASREMVDQSANVVVSEDRYNPIFHIISEINSYVLQFLFYDFLETKEHTIQDRSDLIWHMLCVLDQKRKIKYLEKDAAVFKLLSRGEAEEHISEIFDYFYYKPLMDKYNSQFVFSQKMLGFSHPFGIMVASYIYKKILEDPSNIKMYLGLEKAQGTVGNEEFTMKFLEKLGIPCFKDGKISLDEECACKLTTSLIEIFSMCLDKTKSKNNPIFERYPIINEEYNEKVNQLFDETMPKTK